MGQVSLTVVGPATMGSVMTMDSIDDLGLKEGERVKLIVKAVNVLIVKE